MNADRQRERDELKAALSDPWTVAARLGLEGVKRQARGITARCPVHADTRNSLSVTEGDGGGLIAVCHAGCFKGDEMNLIAAVERLDVRRDFAEVVKRARAVAGLGDLFTARPRTAAPHNSDPMGYAKSQAGVDAAALWASLPPVDADGWDYLRGRGLENATDLCRSVPEVGAGALSGMRLAVAMRDVSGNVAAIQARNLEAGKAHDFRVVGQSGSALFGDPSRLASVKFVFIVEGLTDYLAAATTIGDAPTAAVLGIAGASNTGAVKGLPVKGLRCVVATDADAAGDKCAAEMIDALNVNGAVAVRARPPAPHKDICDMVVAGVDVKAWLRDACKVDLGFRTFGERVEGERAARMADAGKELPFAVAYLDQALGGIAPRDYVLIGAESGGGKTELVTLIAMTNAAKGKRVHYFALEPEPLEIERRIKFKLLSLMVYANGVPSADRLRFQEWQQGKCDDLTGPYEAEADRILSKQYQTLHTFYRSDAGSNFTAGDFDRMARAITDDTDLIVLDHIHFFDEGDDPNREQKRTARQIRDLAIQTGRPVIVVAHLRKKPNGMRKGQRLVPEKDDFEGSSHLFKPVKKAIILAPARDRTSDVGWKWPTYFSVVKNTLDGSRGRYVAVVDWNARTNTYEEPFVLGELVKDGSEFKPVEPAKIPDWARQ